MKIAILCPSSILFMPYLKNYESVLNKSNVDYDIYNWDRFQDEEYPHERKYRDSKTGHQRNFLDYLKYKNFLLNKLESNKYDKLIILGIQISFFLRKYLMKNYKEKFILDIRDYNKIINFYRIDKLVGYSSMVVISSPGFKKWLPSSEKYVTNHNFNSKEFSDIEEKHSTKKNIHISYIGTLRDLDINLNFINSIKNKNRFQVFYHGEGVINQDLLKLRDEKKIKNLHVTGKYFKEEEEGLYNNADLVNVLIPHEDINSKSLLPNRLYQATERGVPLLALKGSYTAEIIAKYKLGLTLNSLTNGDISDEIEDYLKKFNLDSYKKVRREFLNLVIEENSFFETKLIYFLNK